MTIKDQVYGVVIEIDTIGLGRCKLSQTVEGVANQAPSFTISEWNLIQVRINKMFKLANELEIIEKKT